MNYQEQKFIKRKVETKNIMINLIKYNYSDRLRITEYLELLKFLWIELKNRNLLDKYEIAFDVDVESLKRVVEYNSDIFVDDIKYSNDIRIKVPEMLRDYIGRYFIDETIDEIVKNYCDTKDKTSTTLISSSNSINLKKSLVR